MIKKIKFRPLVRYFKKRPKRILIWFSVLAILFVGILQGFKVTPPKAKAAYDGVVINPNGAPQPGEPDTIAIGQTTSFSGNNYCYVNDEYLINKDGYLLQKMMAKVGSCDNGTGDDKFIGYRYYTSASSADSVTVPPQYQISNAVKVTNKNLIIGSGSSGAPATVYLESAGDDSASALALNGLTLENGASLKQVPADREGNNTVYSRERDWAAVFYGYLSIPKNKTIKLSLDYIDSDSDDAAYIYSTDDPNKISSVQFTSESDISQLGIAENYIDTFGAHYYLSGSTVSYSRDNRAPDIGGPITYSNTTGSVQYYPIMIFYRRYDKGGTVQMALKDDVSGSYISLTDFSPPVFEPSGNSWIGRAPANSAEFKAGKMAFAYYNVGYGYNPSYAFVPASPSIVNYRSYFTESIDLNRIPGKNDTTANNLNTSFSYIYEFNNWTNTSTVPNPISHSQRIEGADYLRTSLIDSSVNNSPIKADIRSKLGRARINLKVATTVNVLAGASIDTSGLGYPGGIKNYTLPENDVRFAQYGTSFPDNVANGAGPGGGAYDNQNQGYCGLGGAYGGIGRGCADTLDHINPSTYDNNSSINDPLSLGSGGGAILNGSDAPGGSGGGSIRIEAQDIIVENASIKSNGGHGFNNDDGVDNNSLEKLNYPGWIGNSNPRSSAGSGGSVYLLANNQFINSNNGNISAYGVTGGAEVYDGYNTDFYPRCNDANPGCKGSASGGGRITILYGSGTVRSTDIVVDPSGDPNLENDAIRVTGGLSDIYEIKIDGKNSAGNPDLAEQDNYAYLPPRGGDGTIVIQSLSNVSAVISRNIDISKTVQRCKAAFCDNNPQNGRIDAAEVDTNNATVETNGDWLAVQIKVVNNTGASEKIKVTDERFSGAVISTITPLTSGGAYDNNSTSPDYQKVVWNNNGNGIDITAGQTLYFEYVFQYINSSP